MRLISNKKTEWLFILMGLFFIALIMGYPGKPLYAGEKTLVYYFKNITGDDHYNNYEYNVSKCVYKELVETVGRRRVYIIKPEVFKKYNISRTQYLNENFIINLFTKEKIDQVLFGYFYLVDGKMNIRGRLLSVKSGVVTNITENQELLYSVLKKVGHILLESSEGCGLDKKVRYYSPGKKVKKIIFKEESPISGLIVRTGTTIPVFKWGEHYSSGIYGSFDFYYTPKPLILPIGSGTHFFYYYLQKSTDSYLGSKLNGFGFQPMLTYIKERKGFFGGYGFLLGAGGGLSMLLINDISYLSIDPSVSANFFFVISMFNGLKMVFNAGAYSIIYRSYPFVAYTVSIGVKSGTLRMKHKP